jgi:hypothetical protein
LKAVLDLPAPEELARGALAVEAQEERPAPRELAFELAPAGAAEIDLVISARLVLDEIGQADPVAEQKPILGR